MRVKLNYTPPVERKVVKKRPVRWKRGKMDMWNKGTLIDVNDKDGSLLIADEYTGGLRSVMPEHVEELVEGPRRGKKWVKVDVEQLSN